MNEQVKNDDSEVLHEFGETLKDVSSRASEDDIVSNGFKRIVLMLFGMFGVVGGVVTTYIGQFDFRLLVLGILFVCAGVGLVVASLGNKASISKSFEEFLDSL